VIRYSNGHTKQTSQGKEIARLFLTEHQTSKLYIHGSPGIWSRVPWDTRSTHWELLP